MDPGVFTVFLFCFLAIWGASAWLCLRLLRRRGKSLPSGDPTPTGQPSGGALPATITGLVVATAATAWLYHRYDSDYLFGKGVERAVRQAIQETDPARKEEHIRRAALSSEYGWIKTSQQIDRLASSPEQRCRMQTTLASIPGVRGAEELKELAAKACAR